MSKQYRLYLHANGYFYHRVKVPADIRSLYGKEIQQTSLKTRDFRHAVRRLPAVIVEVDRIFFELRAQNAKGLGTQRGVGGQFPTPVILVKTEHRNHTDDAVDLLEDIRRVVRAEISSFQGEHAANLHEQLSDLASVPDNRDPSEGSTSDVPRQNDLPLLSEISSECFLDVGRQKNWSAKTVAARKSQIGQVIEICDDKPLNRYTQSDVRLLKTVLFALPPQSQGKQQFQGLSKVEIADVAKKLGLPGLSNRLL